MRSKDGLTRGGSLGARNDDGKLRVSPSHGHGFLQPRSSAANDQSKTLDSQHVYIYIGSCLD